jgi:hypothetical protein
MPWAREDRVKKDLEYAAEVFLAHFGAAAWNEAINRYRNSICEGSVHQALIWKRVAEAIAENGASMRVH